MHCMIVDAQAWDIFDICTHMAHRYKVIATVTLVMTLVLGILITIFTVLTLQQEYAWLTKDRKGVSQGSYLVMWYLAADRTQNSELSFM